MRTYEQEVKIGAIVRWMVIVVLFAVAFTLQANPRGTTFEVNCIGCHPGVTTPDGIQHKETGAVAVDGAKHGDGKITGPVASPAARPMSRPIDPDMQIQR
jgi:hypothetical protein